MRILVVTYRMPTSLCSGDRTTIHHLLRFLSQRHEVVFCTPVPDAATAALDGLVAPYCDRTETWRLPKWRSLLQCASGLFTKLPLQTHFFRSEMLRKRIQEIVAAEEIDVVYGYHLRSAQYLVDLDCPTVLDLKPVQSLNLRRMKEYVSGLLRRGLYDFEYQRVRKYEPQMVASVDACLVAADRDRRELDGLDNVLVNPHGMDVEYFSPDPAVEKQANGLIFTGRIGYDPNHDAITYFCRDVLPLVRREIPDVHLSIVGRDPKPDVVKLADDPHIEVTGFVDDMRPYMNRARVAINPLRVGAGMQNKVIESMAMELPLVVTPVANEGIQATPDEHLMVRESPADFAAAIVDLLRNPAKRQQMGKAARNFVVQGWSWDRHFEDTEEILVRLAQQGAVTDHAHATTFPAEPACN